MLLSIPTNAGDGLSPCAPKRSSQCPSIVHEQTKKNFAAMCTYSPFAITPGSERSISLLTKFPLYRRQAKGAEETGQKRAGGGKEKKTKIKKKKSKSPQGIRYIKCPSTIADERRRAWCSHVSIYPVENPAYTSYQTSPAHLHRRPIVAEPHRPSAAEV